MLWRDLVITVKLARFLTDGAQSGTCPQNHEQPEALFQSPLLIGEPLHPGRGQAFLEALSRH